MIQSMVILGILVAIVSFLFVASLISTRGAIEKLRREVAERTRLEQTLSDWNSLTEEEQEEAIRRQRDHEYRQAQEQAKYDGGGW